MVVSGESQQDVSFKVCEGQPRGGKHGFLTYLTSFPNVFEAVKQISVHPFHSQNLMN